MTKKLFVNGTLMRGLGLHKNLAGATFLGEFNTKPYYRIFSINDVHPGMYEVKEGGVAVTGEYYEMSDEIWAAVEAGEPPFLYDGPVQLEDGSIVDGILYPQECIKPEHTDISEFGDWRIYMAHKSSNNKSEI
ncbi:glutamyl-tRNA amidotransferase [Gammaproteobacteria bacterium]|nr:glutamyl-tRNA amidotransferase [Gammaproteobacteria bacterium]